MQVKKRYKKFGELREDYDLFKERMSAVGGVVRRITKREQGQATATATTGRPASMYPGGRTVGSGAVSNDGGAAAAAADDECIVVNAFSTTSKI